MLDNYDKYQDIWYNNIGAYQQVRNRMNIKGLHKNHKVNMQQSKNDMTL